MHAIPPNVACVLVTDAIPPITGPSIAPKIATPIAFPISRPRTVAGEPADSHAAPARPPHDPRAPAPHGPGPRRPGGQPPRVGDPLAAREAKRRRGDDPPAEPDED